MKLCFLVGSMAISGGTYVIVQHAAYLRDHGFDVTLAVQEPFSALTLTWHDEAPALRCIPIAEAKKEYFDLVIATWWKTVFELSHFQAKQYAYFVQSIESNFYPEEEVPLRFLVETTYRFPILYVTEATWIQQYLAEKFGQAAALVRNGIRKDIYTPSGPAIAPRNLARPPRILVEGHFGVSFKNTALSIRLAREAGARDIWVLTGSPVSWLPGVNRVFSQVPMIKTPQIYRSCDILVKLSTVEGMFGPPLEIFHCGGTAIVFDVTGHDEYIVDGVNACVISRGDADRVVRILQRLLSDRDTLSQLQQGALQTAAAWPSWEESSAQFHQWMAGCLQSSAPDRSVLVAMTEQAFADYSHDEQLRLAQNPAIIRRHKLSALASRFPRSVIRKVKQLEAIGEVALGRRTAY